MYLSTYESGLDDKRRMTIPAAFRAVLREKSHDGVLIWKSFRGAYLEGAGMDYILKIKAALDELDPYDDAREAFDMVPRLARESSWGTTLDPEVTWPWFAVHLDVLQAWLSGWVLDWQA